MRALIGQAERVFDEEPLRWRRDFRAMARLDDASVEDVAGTDGTCHIDSLGPALALGGWPT
jgi:hypothetical protein